MPCSSFHLILTLKGDMYWCKCKTIDSSFCIQICFSKAAHIPVFIATL